MARRWPPPTYELTSEEGFPHERTFSIACTIGNTREIGVCLAVALRGRLMEGSEVFVFGYGAEWKVDGRVRGVCVCEWLMEGSVS